MPVFGERFGGFDGEAVQEVRAGELARGFPVGAQLRRAIAHRHRLEGDHVVLGEVVGEAVARRLDLARKMERPDRLARFRGQHRQIVAFRRAGKISVDHAGREPAVADALLLQFVPLRGELVGDQLLVLVARLHPHAPLQLVELDQIEMIEDVAQREIFGRNDARSPEGRRHLGRRRHAARHHVGDRGKLLCRGALRSRGHHAPVQVRLALELLVQLGALLFGLQRGHRVEALERVTAIEHSALVQFVGAFDVSRAPAVLAIDRCAADEHR